MRIPDMSVFSVTTQILFGYGSSAQVGPEAKRLGISKALVVTDKGVNGAGILKDAFASLEKSGIPFDVFDEVPSDPDERVIANSVSLLNKNNCDGVITAGGGSALVAGKATALVGSNGGTIRDYAGVNKYRIPPLACIAIPTTAGSGSEVSKVTVITNEHTKLKMLIIGSNNAPNAAILDPFLLRSLPRSQAVDSGVDALTHAIEAVCARDATPLTDAIALSAIDMIAGNFCGAVLGEDLEAKARMLFGSTMANIACGNAGLGLSHALNLGITQLYKKHVYEPVPYGTIHAICLPHVLDFNLPTCTNKFALIAKSLGVKGADEDTFSLSDRGIRKVKELLSSLNTARKLPWQDVPREQLREVSELVLSTPLAAQNPRKANTSEIVNLLRKCLEGWSL
jgi:alcohol dehydrogenase